MNPVALAMVAFLFTLVGLGFLVAVLMTVPAHWFTPVLLYLCATISIQIATLLFKAAGK